MDKEIVDQRGGKKRKMEEGVEPEPSFKLAGAVNGFTADLYKALYNEEQNLIMSAYSVHVALGMLSLGAKGDTKTEILRGLKIPAQVDNLDGVNKAIRSGYKPVVNGFKKSAGFTLLTANRIYSQVGFDLNPNFMANLKENFDAEMKQLDFSSERKRKAAAKRMNAWVAKTTKDKIKDLINSESLDKTTRLVLINAVYFKGFWEYPFEEELTSKQKFNLTSSKSIRVNMMNVLGDFYYVQLEACDARAVTLPYDGDRLSMIVVLPNAIDGLSKVLQSIESLLQSEDGKSEVTDDMDDNTLIDVSLPRFKFETTFEKLEEVVSKLGMQTMLDQTKADFNDVRVIEDGAGDDIFVSSIIQKAFIEVNERGTEAAAATVISMARKSTKPQPKVIPFVVNRPFYFQIVDHDNEDLVIFSGHCSDPTKSC